LLRKTDKGNLPDFIIIGAARSGTTSLHHYLNIHPEIYMSAEKELSFFIREGNWDKGVEWYRSQFTGDAKIYGEATPRYSGYPVYAGVPERIYSIVPNVKLIYVMRDPMQRALSHYTLFHSLGSEKKSFNDAAADFDRCYYVSASRYHLQIRQYLACFPLSRFFFLTVEELRRQPRQTMQAMYRFLGVDDSFYSPDFAVALNRTDDHRYKNQIGSWLNRLNDLAIVRRIPFRWRVRFGHLIYIPFSSKISRPIISPSMHQRLEELFREDVNGLRALTGRSYAEWSI
jgi:hypothetical protein